VSIGILGILAVAAIIALNPTLQLQKGNDVRRKSDLAQIQRSLESYYQDNGSYPVSIAAPYEILNLAWGASWSPYMNRLPEDPNSNQKYVYYSSGQSYYIYATLDRGSLDSQACSNLDANGECSSIAVNGIAVKSCGGACNYGVSSPDVAP
jgi:type II secretory pathway pseudopilin PulG